MAKSSTDSNPESSTSSERDETGTLRPVRTVLLCGASVRSLAESAIAARLRPLCVDFFKDQDLTALLSHGRGRFVGRMNSFSDLPRLTHSIRTSIPLFWAGGLENHTDVIRAIARRRPVIGADPDLVDSLRNPENLQRWLSAADLNTPRLATPATVDPDRMWLTKPIACSGGLGIRAHSRSRTGHSQELFQESSRQYLQEYIDGVPMSALFCSDRQCIEHIGTSLQCVGWPSLGASDFLFCGNVGPVDPGHQVTEQVVAAAKTIIEQTGLRGVFGIDFILRQGRAWFLEVNPRLTASHLIYENTDSGSSPRLNLVARHLAAFGWSPAHAKSRTTAIAAKRTGEHTDLIMARLIIWGREDFVVSEDFSMRAVRNIGSSTSLADLPAAGIVINRHSPICSIQLNGESMTSVVKQITGLGSDIAGLLPIDWSSVGQQLALLAERFRQNK